MCAYMREREREIGRTRETHSPYRPSLKQPRPCVPNAPFLLSTLYPVSLLLYHVVYHVSPAAPSMSCFHFSSSQAKEWMNWWSGMLHLSIALNNSCCDQYLCTAHSEVNHCQPHFKWLISSDLTTPNYFSPPQRLGSKVWHEGRQGSFCSS